MLIPLRNACERVGITVDAYTERLRGRTLVGVPFPCYKNEAGRRVVYLADVEAYLASDNLVRLGESRPRSSVRVSFGGRKKGPRLTTGAEEKSYVQ